ncbi:MAG: hypothetical protein LBR58_11475 [Propionibacteriaceae bacterium]|jgi:hypothetical protein|nr:hypothetical protein [Propionibacteriaceae bacterium]
MTSGRYGLTRAYFIDTEVRADEAALHAAADWLATEIPQLMASARQTLTASQNAMVWSGSGSNAFHERCSELEPWCDAFEQAALGLSAVIGNYATVVENAKIVAGKLRAEASMIGLNSSSDGFTIGSPGSNPYLEYETYDDPEAVLTPQQKLDRETEWKQWGVWISASRAWARIRVELNAAADLVAANEKVIIDLAVEPVDVLSMALDGTSGFADELLKSADVPGSGKLAQLATQTVWVKRLARFSHPAWGFVTGVAFDRGVDKPFVQSLISNAAATGASAAAGSVARAALILAFGGNPVTCIGAVAASILAGYFAGGAVDSLFEMWDSGPQPYPIPELPTAEEGIMDYYYAHNRATYGYREVRY